MKKAFGENSRIHIHQTESEVTLYQKQEKKHEKKVPFVLLLLLIWVGLFFSSLFFTVSYRQFDFSIAWVLKYVTLNMGNFYHFVMGNGAADGMDARFYQYLVIALAGAALAACGVIFQGAFKNLLAGPSSMGVMAGGTLGCTIYLCFFSASTGEAVVYDAAERAEAYMESGILHRYAPQLSVLLGCLGGVLFVMAVATMAGRGGKLSSSAMVVSGSVFSAIVGNITMLAQYWMLLQDPEDTRVEAIRNMMMGNFNLVGRPEVLAMMGIPIGCCLICLIALRGRLNLLSFGDEEAASMGLNAPLYRNLVVAIGTILTASVVAFCGHVGFLGFMVPLIGRKIAGPDLRQLIPVSLPLGAILLTIIFDVSYFIGLSDSLNVVTSAIGCVVMAIILVTKKGAG